MAGRSSKQNGDPQHPPDDIPLHLMEGSEEDENGYVHSSRVDAGGAEPRRPSVPFHTRNLIKQLPSRNLDDLSTPEPDAVISEKPQGDRAPSSEAGSKRQRDNWRYLTLRVRAATANNASDLSADDLYHILRADSNFSEAVALATLRNSKQSLTLKRSVKRRLTSSRADHATAAHRSVSWWRRTKFSLAMGVQRMKRNLWDALSHVDLWHSHLKDIQGNFGSGVASYFLFLRRLLALNLFMGALLMGFVTVPQLIYERSPSAMRSDYSADVGYVQAFFNIFTGAGLFADTVMYYGHYTNETVRWPPRNPLSYDLPLAYFFAVAVCLFACLVTLAYSLTRSYKQNYIETSMGVKDVYCAKVFSAWDFSIASHEAAKLKSRSIYNELKELLSMERRAEEDPPTCGARTGKVLARIAVNLVIMGIMTVSGWLVYDLLQKKSLQSDVPVLGEMTVSLTVGALCFVLPTLFLALSRLEFIHRVQTRLYLNLARVTLAKIVLLGVLMYYWLGAQRRQDECWESRLGQELYRLLVVDTAFVLLLTTGVGESLRSLVYKHITPRVGPPELDIAHNTLDLIYTQTLVWAGLFYCPLLPMVACAKLVLTFYVKRVSVMCTQPSVRPWRAVHAQTVFLALTFLSFVLATGTLGYALLSIQPSEVCGPFKGLETTYAAFLGLFNLDSWQAGEQTETGRVFQYLLSPFAFFLGIVVLSLWLYYMRALAHAHAEMVALLREQLIMEGKDKVFLLQLFEKSMEQKMAMHKFGTLRMREHASADLTPLGSLRRRTGGSGGGSSTEGSPQRSLGSLPRPQHQQGFRYLAQ
ncbi:transmembrane channel-like protein 5 [Amblyomma americanum]